MDDCSLVARFHQLFLQLVDVCLEPFDVLYHCGALLAFRSNLTRIDVSEIRDVSAYLFPIDFYRYSWMYFQVSDYAGIQFGLEVKQVVLGLGLTVELVTVQRDLLSAVLVPASTQPVQP